MFKTHLFANDVCQSFAELDSDPVTFLIWTSQAGLQPETMDTRVQATSQQHSVRIKLCAVHTLYQSN